MILYDAARCPYCARVRIVLAEKGLPYETVEIDLSDRPAWLYEKNPLGKVPVLEEDGGLVLPESEVVSEYLDERFPEPPLWPADPAERALGRLWLQRFEGRLGDDYYARRRGEPSRLEERLAQLDAALEAQPFLSGREYGLADIGYVPWILRARSNLGVELAPYEALAAWLERLSERPAVAAELELQLQSAAPAEAGTASSATSQATSRTR
jgi:glutathione S-transferase